MSTIYDLQDAQVDELIQLADLQFLDKILTRDDLNAAIRALIGEFKAAPSWQQAEIASGAIAIERRAIITFVEVDTEGLAATSDLSKINGAFDDGDMIVLRATSIARQVRVLDGSLQVNQGLFVMDDFGDTIAFIRYGGSYYEIFRHPWNIAELQTYTQEEVVIISQAVTVTKPIVAAAYYTGETIAMGGVTIDTGGIGSVSVFSDEGQGAFLIGSASFAIPTTPADIADALQLTWPVGGYSATILGDPATVVISAPVGRGAAANFYLLTSTVTGAITTTVTPFAGGADGAETNAKLDTINGGDDLQRITIRNRMATATIEIEETGNIIGNTILEAGMWTDAYRFGAAWVLMGCGAHIVPEGYAEMYIKTPATTTIGGAGTPVKTAGTFEAAAGMVGAWFTFDSGNNWIEYTNATERLFRISVNQSVQCATNNQVISLYVGHNLAHLGKSRQVTKLEPINSLISASSHCIVKLQQGDTIDPWIANETAANDLTVGFANLIITEI